MAISAALHKADAKTWRARGAADCLALAAAPIFSLMAFIAANDASRARLCFMGSNPLPIGGMTAMYLLMALFHVSPWLKLVASHGWASGSKTSKGD